MLETFLKNVIKNDIHLVAIVPDTIHISGQYFASDASAATAWAMERNAAGANVYWTVNICDPACGHKPTKQDIRAVRFLHCDIDPPKGAASLDKQATLATIVARGAPSFVVDSGNGLQPIWRLSEPMSPDAAESVNRGIAYALGGDHCHNIDRLLRLPGTINWPNARKVTQGRTPVPTGVAQGDTGAWYAPDTLVTSFPPPPASERSAALPDLGPWRYETPETLPACPDNVRKLIEDPRGEDRSNDVVLCAAEMIRAGYTVEQVFGTITNPVNAVSAHVLDQGNPERAALRLIGPGMGGAPSDRFQPVEMPAAAVPVESVAQTEPDASAPFGPILSSWQYPEYFAGCVYVRSLDAVYTPDGFLRKKSALDTQYGGRSFVMDGEGTKLSDSAWDAFRLSHVFRPVQVEELCFRPEEPSGAVIVDEGRALLNTYVPIETRRVEGDPAPFLDLLQKLFPVDRDRAIITAYMCALVQNPGRKFQWWPVIQGGEGNGKSTLLRVLSHAVGHRYTHLVNPEAMAKTGNQFNAWIEGNLLVGLEEIYMGNRREFLDSFKTTVTNDRMPVEGKGKDQRPGDNRCNGIMLTNHTNAIPANVDTRRYCIFITPQQTASDLERCGMGGEYFPRLYDWLRADGYAIVNNWLQTTEPAAEFNPAGLCQRAPLSSSFDVARAASLGPMEEHIQEAIDEGRPGFRNGWVSSKAATDLLRGLRYTVGPRRVGDVLAALGYHKHPALHEGRINNPLPDGSKPRLYINETVDATRLPAVEAYLAAQGDAEAPASNVVPFSRA